MGYLDATTITNIMNSLRIDSWTFGLSIGSIIAVPLGALIAIMVLKKVVWI